MFFDKVLYSYQQQTINQQKQLMIADQFTEDIELKAFSTTLNPITKTVNHKEPPIQPWYNDAKQGFKTQLSLRNGRLQTLENRNTQRKKSMDERIVQMYRKYSNEGSLIQNGKQGVLNSREVYREKLKQFENCSQFKRMGSKRQHQQSQLYTSQTKQSDELSFRKANVYCCDYSEFRGNLENQKKIKSDYKCNDKFQRMLKIKDKIRRKNNQTVSKQKQKYQNQYEPQALNTHREINYAVMAKATIERNKLKIKMRGLSKEELRKKKEFSNQLNNIEIVGYESNNGNTIIPKEGILLTYERWKRLEKESLVDKMSQTLHYFNH